MSSNADPMKLTVEQSKSNPSKSYHLMDADNLLRLNLTRTEKSANPPLRPAPIENPFAEAVTILQTFSESVNVTELSPSKSP